jgi:hypothetical protein
MWSAPEFDSARQRTREAFSLEQAGGAMHEAWLSVCYLLGAPVPWAGITALAEALLVHQELECERVLEIIAPAIRTKAAELGVSPQPTNIEAAA